jgi:hypothetical protein
MQPLGANNQHSTKQKKELTPHLAFTQYPIFWEAKVRENDE